MHNKITNNNISNLQEGLKDSDLKYRIVTKGLNRKKNPIVTSRYIWTLVLLVIKFTVKS